MIIRAAKQKDLKYCAKLLRSKEFAFADGGYPNSRYLKYYLNPSFFLIAEENKEIIGCILGEPLKANVAVIWYFVVRKDMRNKKIGSKLFKELAKRCKKKGFEWFLAHAAVNKKTLNFYRKNGWNQGTPCVEFNKQI